jgi:hypothetical protein
MRASAQRQLDALEVSYRELLLAALRKCAAGQWGLFAHNRFRLPDRTVDELPELGSTIERMRGRLGLEPFPLHERLQTMRSSHDSNTPGEPKRARQWLDELIGRASC